MVCCSTTARNITRAQASFSTASPVKKKSRNAIPSHRVAGREQVRIYTPDLPNKRNTAEVEKRSGGVEGQKEAFAAPPTCSPYSNTLYLVSMRPCGGLSHEYRELGLDVVCVEDHPTQAEDVVLQLALYLDLKLLRHCGDEVQVELDQPSQDPCVERERDNITHTFMTYIGTSFARGIWT